MTGFSILISGVIRWKHHEIASISAYHKVLICEGTVTLPEYKSNSLNTHFCQPQPIKKKCFTDNEGLIFPLKQNSKIHSLIHRHHKKIAAYSSKSDE